MPRRRMRLYPFQNICDSALALLAAGGHFHLQFNCAACGTKQTIETPDTLYKTGRCEECGAVTDIERDGANLLAIFGAEP